MTLEALQAWVVQTGLSVSLLIGFILVIRRPFGRIFGANAAYALWSLPLIRMCMPGFSIPQRWVPEFLQLSSKTPTLASPLEVPANRYSPFNGETDVFAPAQLAPTEPIQWGIILLSVWVSVATLWLGYQLSQQARYKSHLVAQSFEPNARLTSEIDRAANRVGLRKRPKVRVASGKIGPLVTGVFNPLVIVPNHFDETFEPQQRYFALVHEFAHIKRFDLWAALATLMFRALNWPNPLVHYASHKLRGDQEAACDAFVVRVTGVETAHSYAETLVKAVRQDRGPAGKVTHLALSLAEADSEISKGD